MEDQDLVTREDLDVFMQEIKKNYLPIDQFQKYKDYVTSEFQARDLEIKIAKESTTVSTLSSLSLFSGAGTAYSISLMNMADITEKTGPLLGTIIFGIASAVYAYSAWDTAQDIKRYKKQFTDCVERSTSLIKSPNFPRKPIALL